MYKFKGGQEAPLVSCIMPTYNRREFVSHAIRYFLRQEYENKELIIVDDGTDSIKDLIPDDPNIRYFYLDGKITLGAKLNLACDYAKGNIIAHWDDDDWYAPRRLGYQVDTLINTGAEVCGINNLLYYDLNNKKAFQYIYPSNQRVWLIGSSLCYQKKLWYWNKFADIDVGMDGLFVWATPPEQVRVLPDSSFSVHMIHNRNISPKKTDGCWWHTYPEENIRTVLNNDWDFYNHGNSAFIQQDVEPVAQMSFIADQQKKQSKKLQNIHACLVHEKEDCIIDLIQNLHYHDPSSIILLYNGSENSNLISKHFPYEQLQVVVVPDPIPVKHGYLFNFVLHCMQYALENLSFDTLTIVDSDQLAARSDYSEYLSSFLSSRPDIGMLSNAPERITPDNKINHVALQAFKEYHLWKPFLDNFPDIEGKFVHWTFWPSTVFSYYAIKDLVKLYQESRQLQEVIAHSKIWASEEVILPTLVRLLGYKIDLNPCSHDYVKYRATYTIGDINAAMNKVDAFWVHPIQRILDDPLRKLIRERSNYYTAKNEIASIKNYLTFDPLHVPLLDKVKKIEGWLSNQEAELLIAFTNKACIGLSAPHNIVEIGSYHGKSTVLFGSVVKQLFPQAKIYAIDTHDGKLGAEGPGLQTFPPSYEMFKKNIENAGIADIVECIKSRSYEVEWQRSVSLLFVDGLHDYLNVAKDFWHFSKWIVPGGYVAFHDYAHYFPGVQAFVDELLGTGSYKKIGMADSLIILKKL